MLDADDDDEVVVVDEACTSERENETYHAEKKIQFF